MVNGKPTFISLFAGCGGSSLGYRWAGYKELLAIDFDKNAVETFRLNFPDVPCWKRDIREVTGKEIVEFCRIKKGELDLLDASPPCQGFSTVGKRNVNDSRNDLFQEFVRLIKELEPKVFVMENVSGLIKGKMKGRFIEIMKELKSLPYQVKCKLMNAMYYGVPQSRQRLVWIGIKEGLKEKISYPKASNEIISVREALKGVDGAGNHNPKLLDKNTKSYKGYFKAKGTKVAVLGQSLYRLEANKPSFTIKGSSEHFHYSEPRRLTVREYLRLFSYPDNFIVKNQNHKNVGNSVPPKFMEAIARQIRATVEYG